MNHASAIAESNVLRRRSSGPSFHTAWVSSRHRADQHRTSAFGPKAGIEHGRQARFAMPVMHGPAASAASFGIPSEDGGNLNEYS
jgi:hypothetical protein